MIKAVIFDMDGVLIDSEGIYMEADKKIFQDMNICMEMKELETYVGKNANDMWNEILQKYNLKDKYELNGIIQYHRSVFLDALIACKDLTLIDGIRDWMDYFKERRIKMAIASSSCKEIIEYIINRFQLNEYIEFFVDGDAVIKGKPHPEIFLKAAAYLEVNPEECLVIEDSYNGVKAAKSAGMKCIGFRNINSGAQDLSLGDQVIDSYDKDMLDRIMNL